MKIFKFLEKKKCNMNNIPNKCSPTPLIKAIMLNIPINSISIILNNTNTLNKTYVGKTALQYAYEQSNLKLIKLLLTKGANINEIHWDNDKSLQYQIINYIIKYKLVSHQNIVKSYPAFKYLLLKETQIINICKKCNSQTDTLYDENCINCFTPFLI